MRREEGSICMCTLLHYQPHFKAARKSTGHPAGVSLLRVNPFYSERSFPSLASSPRFYFLGAWQLSSAFPRCTLKSVVCAYFDPVSVSEYKFEYGMISSPVLRSVFDA